MHSEIDCTGNFCIAYGTCGAPVNKNDSDPVLFNIGPDVNGTGLVMSIQSSYSRQTKFCTHCSKSGIKKLRDVVEWDGKVQVYTGPRSFSFGAVLTIYES